MYICIYVKFASLEFEVKFGSSVYTGSGLNFRGDLAQPLLMTD